MHGFISGLSVLFCWSVFLFLGQYHPIDECGFVVLSEVGNVDFSSSILFFKTALAIRGLLCFHRNCETFCSSSVKNVMGNLIGIALNL